MPKLIIPAVQRICCAFLAATSLWAASGCAIVDFEQRRWIFQPTSQAWAPGVAAAQGMKEVWIDYQSKHPEHDGQDVRLHALWLPHDNPAAPVLLFLHGSGWDVVASAPRMRNMHTLGFAVLCVDYRGFGRSSEALPSETLVAEDARAAWDWLGREHPDLPRYVFGHSLGAAIAVQLAHDVDDEAGVIIEGSFTSVADVFRSYSWGWLPITRFITQHFDAAARIAHIGSPLLMVHGGEDSMVLPALGRALYDKALAPKRFVLIPGAVHENTNTVGLPQYRQALADFFGLRP